MKIKILVIAILFITSCSSIQKSDNVISLNTLIEKSKLDYKIRSLPKEIHLFFLQTEEVSSLPAEVQGFVTNSYHYNSEISYRPQILLFPMKNGECIVQESNADLNVVFYLSTKKNNTSLKKCFQKLPKSKTLFISKNSDNFGFDSAFIVSREEEKRKLIKEMEAFADKFIVIDEINNIDNDSVMRLLKEEEKQIIGSKTFNYAESSQDFFSEILKVNRSKERLRKLSRRISKPIEGNLRIREDVNSFFFSINLEQARNLKPALDYVSERNFNIFILNSWESNDYYKYVEKDLNGSVHSDFPIMMPIEMPKFISDEKRSREFAIGYDTYEIILLKYGSVKTRNHTYKGLSGKINIQGNEIKRSAYLFEINQTGIEIL